MITYSVPYVILFYLFFTLFPLLSSLFFFFFNDTATTEIYTLSLHDALPIPPAASTTSLGRTNHREPSSRRISSVSTVPGSCFVPRSPTVACSTSVTLEERTTRW